MALWEGIGPDRDCDPAAVVLRRAAGRRRGASPTLPPPSVPSANALGLRGGSHIGPGRNDGPIRDRRHSLRLQLSLRAEPQSDRDGCFDLSWTAYLTDLGTIVKDAKSIAGAVSSIIGGFNAAVSVLQFLGLLPAPVDEVAVLTQDVNAIATGATWQALHDYVDPLLSDIQTVAQIRHPRARGQQRGHERRRPRRGQRCPETIYLQRLAPSGCGQGKRLEH